MSRSIKYRASVFVAIALVASSANAAHTATWINFTSNPITVEKGTDATCISESGPPSFVVPANDIYQFPIAFDTFCLAKWGIDWSVKNVSSSPAGYGVQVSYGVWADDSYDWVGQVTAPKGQKVSFEATCTGTNDSCLNKKVKLGNVFSGNYDLTILLKPGVP